LYLFLLEAESNPGPWCGRNFSDPIGNRTRELSACSAESQLIAPPRAPLHSGGTQFKYRPCMFLVPSGERKKNELKILFQIRELGVACQGVMMKEIEFCETSGNVYLTK